MTALGIDPGQADTRTLEAIVLLPASGGAVTIPNPFAPASKYHARRTWSEMCQHYFDSKAEANHAEELWLLQKAGEISGLEFHPVYVLRAEKPRVKYVADFRYTTWERRQLVQVVEDVKGRETPASRIKRAWLLDKLGVEVRIVWV